MEWESGAKDTVEGEKKKKVVNVSERSIFFNLYPKIKKKKKSFL